MMLKIKNIKKNGIMPPNFINVIERKKIGGHTKPRVEPLQAMQCLGFQGGGGNIPSPDAPVCDLYQLNL